MEPYFIELFFIKKNVAVICTLVAMNMMNLNRSSGDGHLMEIKIIHWRMN